MPAWRGVQPMTHVKNNLSAYGPACGGIAKRFKMLTYYCVCSTFSPFRASDDKLGIFNLP
jgi:hypothetical protein